MVVNAACLCYWLFYFRSHTVGAWTSCCLHPPDGSWNRGRWRHHHAQQTQAEGGGPHQQSAAHQRRGQLRDTRDHQRGLHPSALQRLVKLQQDLSVPECSTLKWLNSTLQTKVNTSWLSDCWESKIKKKLHTWCDRVLPSNPLTHRLCTCFPVKMLLFWQSHGTDYFPPAVKLTERPALLFYL